LAESQDATLLQRRARRRLVGAIALVVLVVIVLPIVLDTEPSPIGQDLVVQIPSQEAGKFNTRVLTPAAPGAATPPLGGAGDAAPEKSEALTPRAAPKDAKADVKGAAKADAKAAAPAAAKTAPPAVAVEANATSPASAKSQPPSPAKDQIRAAKGESDAARAKALLEGKEAWVVRLGAFSNQDNVRQLQAKLTAAGVKSYTEAAKGPKGDQTRVRAGPFGSKSEAEQANEKLAAVGIRPGSVAAQ
jgi:DedD protein